MTRVAYLSSRYPAVSHTFIQREVEALRDAGIDLHTFSVRPPLPDDLLDARAVAARDETFSVLPAPLGEVLSAHLDALVRRPWAYLTTAREALRHRLGGLRALAWSLFYFVEAIRLARELERREVEWLHNHFANAGAVVGLLAARHLSLPWSLTLHGISEFDHPSGALLPAKVDAARFVACVSHFTRAQAFRLCAPDTWDRFGIVRCGVDAASIEPVPPPTDGPLRLVCVGRLTPEKGHGMLLEAFARLVARGHDLQLRLVGDGPLRGELQARLATLGLSERVLLLGSLPPDRVTDELRACHAFVLSSFMEGLPVSLIEAMAQRRPVVAPRVAGIPELVEHERSGLLFTVADVDDLEATLERLVGDPSLREVLAEEGRARVEDGFDVARAVAPLVERWR